MYEREAGACDFFQAAEAAAGMSPAMMGGLGGAVLLVITCVLVAVFAMRRRGKEEGVYDDPAIVVAKIRAAGGSLSMYNPAYDPTPGLNVRSDGFGSPMSNHGAKGPWDEGVTMAYGERAMDNPLYAGPQDEPQSFGFAEGMGRTASTRSSQRASWMSTSSGLGSAPDDDDDGGSAEPVDNPHTAGSYLDVQPDPGSEDETNSSDNDTGFGYDSDDGDPDLFGELSSSPPLPPPPRNASKPKAPKSKAKTAAKAKSAKPPKAAKKVKAPGAPVVFAKFGG